MSFTQSVFHIVFSTKNRQPTINTTYERNFYKILYDIMQQLGGHVYRIGGMPDHIHILVDITAQNSLSSFVKELKQKSSYIAGRMEEFPKWDGWEEGYAGFSYSISDIPTIENYIRNQKEHHKRTSFRDECRAWLIEMGVSPDAPYFPK